MSFSLKVSDILNLDYFIQNQIIPRIELQTLYFYQKSNMYSSAPTNILTQEFKVKKSDLIIKKIQSWLSNSISSTGNIIIIPIVNGIAIIDLKKSTITKIVERKLERSFLENELLASKIIPEYTPKFINSGKIGIYDFITTQFISKIVWLRFDDWPKMTEEVSTVYGKLLKKGKAYLKKRKVVNYINQLELNSKQELKSAKYLKKEFRELQKILNITINKYGKSGVSYIGFSHGDLTLNNVIKLKNKIVLFDFGNGGMQNIFYDLMIQDFYQPDSYVWKNFNKVSFLDNNEDKIFKGWSGSYIDTLKREYNIVVTNEDVRIGVLLALYENGLKNFIRYQNEDGRNDCLVIFRTIETICKNILSK